VDRSTIMVATPSHERSLAMSDPHHSMDHRVYLIRKEFQAATRTSEPTLYCNRAESPEGGFHLIADGEIYVHSEDITYCLNCAIALAIATSERPNLLRGARMAPNPSPETPTL
jgi:hypothetical protein